MSAIEFVPGPQVAGTVVIDSFDVEWTVLKNIANAQAQPREGAYYTRVITPVIVAPDRLTIVEKELAKLQSEFQAFITEFKNHRHITPEDILEAYQQGYGWYLGETTGGLGGETVYAKNYEELKVHLKSTLPLVIICEGTISGTSATVNTGYQCESNKTILGKPGTLFKGFNLSWFNKKNIIIRNIKFVDMPDFPAAGLGKKDYITFYNTQRICVNHCHFVETAGTDSHLDIIDGSDWITISDCLFEGGDKGSLVGAGVEPLREKDKLHASFFRNRYIDIMERAPSYRAGSYCHVMNDLHESPTLDWQYTYACGSRNGATIRVENSDFSEFNGWALQSINSDANSTDAQQYGVFSGIKTNIYGPNATIALKGTVESTWVEPYDTSDYKLEVDKVKALVRVSAGATLTLAKLGLQ